MCYGVVHSPVDKQDISKGRCLSCVFPRWLGDNASEETCTSQSFPDLSKTGTNYKSTSKHIQRCFNSTKLHIGTLRSWGFFNVSGRTQSGLLCDKPLPSQNPMPFFCLHAIHCILKACELNYTVLNTIFLNVSFPSWLPSSGLQWNGNSE